MRDLILAGMDVARLNFSHGAHESISNAFSGCVRQQPSLRSTLCILQDLQGPKIRTGRLKYHHPVALTAGRRA